MFSLLHLAGVPALVHNPRPPEVTDDGWGKPALYRDGVDSLVELADPLPPAHPAVLWSAGGYHALKIRTGAVVDIITVPLQMQNSLA